MKVSSFSLGICAFLISFILLILPGDELPKAKFFDIEGFDKIVHTIMFAGLTWLFCLPFRRSGFSTSERKKWFLKIAFCALLYGLLMELVQKYFVPFRSFELADIFVDGAGAMIGYFISHQLFSKTEGV